MSSAVRPLPAPLFGDDERAELFDLIATRSFRHGRFTLSSGVESNLYFNLKPTMMHPRGAYLAARAFLDVVHAEGATYVGGLEMGAVPLIGAMAAVGESEARPVRTFFIRKQAKAHGTRDLLEGLAADETLQDALVVVADDVATSGASMLRTVEAARNAGARVGAALALVDREEGAAELLAGRDVRLLAIFSARQFA
jgi:orotate phosphoribosyltransferase